MTLTELAAWAQPIFVVLEPLLVPVVTWAAWAIVAEMRKRGWKADYVAAIPRAMGAGILEAQKRGVDPFSQAGRLIVAREGAAYITKFVGAQVGKLSIADDTHGERVLAQLGVAAGEAQAAVQATAATVAATIQPAAAVLSAAVALTDAATAIKAAAQAAPGPARPQGPPPDKGSSAAPPYYPPGVR